MHRLVSVWIPIFAISLAACDREDTPAVDEPDSAMPVDAATPDEAGDAPMTFTRRCAAGAEFVTTTELSELAILNSEQSEGVLTPDELTIYFTRTHHSGGFTSTQLDYATRPAADEPFGFSYSLSGLAGSHPAVRWDGLELFAVRGYKIVHERRSSTSEAFSSDPPVAETLDLPGAEADPWLSPDGLTLLFAATQPQNGYDIFIATRASVDADFEAPTPLLGGPSAQRNPVLSADGLELLYTTDYSGNQRERITTRASTSEEFGYGDWLWVSTPGELVASWLSADGCRVIYSYQTLVGDRQNGRQMKILSRELL